MIIASKILCPTIKEAREVVAVAVQTMLRFIYLLEMKYAWGCSGRSRHTQSIRMRPMVRHWVPFVQPLRVVSDALRSIHQTGDNRGGHHDENNE